jgi:hypothetical protein
VSFSADISPTHVGKELVRGSRLAHNFLSQPVFLKSAALGDARSTVFFIATGGSLVAHGVRHSSPVLINAVCALALVSPTLAAFTYGLSLLLNSAAALLQRSRY